MAYLLTTACYRVAVHVKPLDMQVPRGGEPITEFLEATRERREYAVIRIQ